MIPKDFLDANTDYVNLLMNHGEINIITITKIKYTYIRKESRIAKVTNMLYCCLINLLSKVGKYNVSLCNSQHKVNGSFQEI